jgi:ATP dependent DNA ligase-like protein
VPLCSEGFVPPCIPTRAVKPPAGPDWMIHEITHDGYRLQVRREGDAVRLFTRSGYDWTARYPAIAVTAAELRARSFTLDGEAAVCVVRTPSANGVCRLFTLEVANIGSCEPSSQLGQAPRSVLRSWSSGYQQRHRG